MYYINIMDLNTGKEWQEKFDSYYLFRDRVIKLKYSKKLIILSRSRLESEKYR